MSSCRGVWVWVALLSAFPAQAKPAPMQCKPCGAPPLEAALDQAQAVVLAKVLATLDPLPTKGEAGEGFIRVQVTQWLYRSKVLTHPLPATKGLHTLRVRFYWDGCRAAPSAFQKNERVVLFLSQGEAYSGADPAWEATPHPCTLGLLRPGDEGDGLRALKKRLKSRS